MIFRKFLRIEYRQHDGYKAADLRLFNASTHRLKFQKSRCFLLNLFDKMKILLFLLLISVAYSLADIIGQHFLIEGDCNVEICTDLCSHIYLKLVGYCVLGNKCSCLINQKMPLRFPNIL
ncbi:hypothetical protein TSAR_015923 [Trichomalopsis sarcophagae]|uniref:Uncharacterized protein n=1 Tax=Trichomalopsis sarcophagae TaxID=543379 RepID=A0A232EXE4_9HYME|nr:hypothetical protein TSAR_015923 [Trichomalopsis sarcophagae]